MAANVNVFHDMIYFDEVFSETERQKVFSSIASKLLKTYNVHFV